VHLGPLTSDACASPAPSTLPRQRSAFVEFDVHTSSPHQTPSQDAALPPSDSGPQAFGGPHQSAELLATSFGGLHPFTGLSAPILFADLSLLQGFSLLYSQFPCSMFSRATSFLGAYSICMHHPSMFCVCTPPTLLFLLHFLLAYFSFLFLCAPLCAVYLEGYSFVATSFLQDLRFPTDLATSCVKIGAIDL
jgi:hypothetical protein